jgi:hypothetical protein
MNQNGSIRSRELREILLGALVGLGRAAEGNKNRPSSKTNEILISGLKMIIMQDVSDSMIREQIKKIQEEKYLLIPRCLTCKKQCGRNNDYKINEFYEDYSMIREKKVTILSEILLLAEISTEPDERLCELLYDVLFWLGKKGTSVEIEHIAEHVHIMFQQRFLSYLCCGPIEELLCMS